MLVVVWQEALVFGRGESDTDLFDAGETGGFGDVTSWRPGARDCGPDLPRIELLVFPIIDGGP